jgi:methylenetetrahydrofolate reductase (NADPH)
MEKNTPLIGRAFGTKPTFSFEVFPAKTPQAREQLVRTVGELCALGPDFISCTYGAGGGSREGTLDIVELIQKKHGVAAMAHLTCVQQSHAEIESVLDDIFRRGITNILALRGDPPKDQQNAPWTGDFKYSSELVAFIRRRFGQKVSIGVAGFPEKHPLAPTADADASFLKLKVEAGAEFVITQLFFDNKLYFDYVARLKKTGVTAPVVPGILPVLDYEALKRFCAMCGASIPKAVHDIFAPLSGDPKATVEAGIQYAIRQSRELLAGGAPGIHFYALNKTYSVERILQALRPR